MFQWVMLVGTAFEYTMHVQNKLRSDDMDGKVYIEISQDLLHRLDLLHEEYRKLSPSMATQDINYMLHRIVVNEECRVGLKDDKPYPHLE